MKSISLAQGKTICTYQSCNKERVSKHHTYCLEHRQLIARESQRRQYIPKQPKQFSDYLLGIVERRRVARENREAKLRGEPATLTTEEWAETLKYFNKRCAYCGAEYSVLEHFAPIGSGVGTTKRNCVPACGSCNILKAVNYDGFLERAVNIGMFRQFQAENPHSSD